MKFRHPLNRRNKVAVIGVFEADFDAPVRRDLTVTCEEKIDRCLVIYSAANIQTGIKIER